MVLKYFTTRFLKLLKGIRSLTIQSSILQSSYSQKHFLGIDQETTRRRILLKKCSQVCLLTRLFQLRINLWEEESHDLMMTQKRYFQKKPSDATSLIKINWNNYFSSTMNTTSWRMDQELCGEKSQIRIWESNLELFWNSAEIIIWFHTCLTSNPYKKL